MKKNKLVEVKLHGVLGEQMKRSTWNLAVNTLGEACHAINTLTKKCFFKQLLENDKKNIKYEVLINQRKLVFEKKFDTKNIEQIKQSELCARYDDLETIDIVPVLEFADEDTMSIITIIVGVVLVIVGIFTSPFGVGFALVIAGLGLIAAGVINLLSQPPQFEQFREISGGGRVSYLFAGPVNTVGEGGPVPLVYGRLLTGSHVISASYEVSDIDASLEVGKI